MAAVDLRPGSVWWAAAMAVGSEWARIMGGALTALEPLWERRWVRA